MQSTVLSLHWTVMWICVIFDVKFLGWHLGLYILIVYYSLQSWWCWVGWNWLNHLCQLGIEYSWLCRNNIGQSQFTEEKFSLWYSHFGRKFNLNIIVFCYDECVNLCCGNAARNVTCMYVSLVKWLVYFSLWNWFFKKLCECRVKIWNVGSRKFCC